MLTAKVIIGVLAAFATSSPTGQDTYPNMLARADCRFDDCAPQQCGGITGRPCPPGMTCVDNPNDDCSPNKGGADCIGICVRPQPCGGKAGLPCPKGMKCVDDPTDNCDPRKGGADCIGTCV